MSARSATALEAPDAGRRGRRQAERNGKPMNPAKVGKAAKAAKAGQAGRSARSGKGGAARRPLPAVNLLSPWSFERMAVRRLRLRFLAAAVVLVAAVGAVWPVQALRVSDAEGLLAVEQAETARVQEQTSALQPVRTFVAGVEAQKTTISETMAREIFFSEALEAMQDAAPAGVRLDSLVVTLAEAPVTPEAAAPAAPAEGAEDGAAAEAAPPAAPPVASPCPGPDPFNTRTVVGCVTLNGTASTRTDVGDFVVNLGAEKLFVEPFVSTTTTADGAQVTFTGSVGLSEKVFSGRYATIDKMLKGGAR